MTDIVQICRQMSNGIVLTRPDSDIQLHVIAALDEKVSSRGMTPAELARRSGIKSRTVYRLLRGEQSLSLDQIWSLARGLDISPAELLPLPVGGEAGEAMSEAEQALLEGVRADDPTAVRSALTAIMSGPAFASLLGGQALSEVDQRRFYEAMEATGAELIRLARLAAKASEGGGDREDQ